MFVRIAVDKLVHYTRFVHNTRYCIHTPTNVFLPYELHELGFPVLNIHHASRLRKPFFIFPQVRRLIVNKDVCIRLRKYVIHWQNDRDWHAYVRGFIEKIDPCRSMVNLFIGEPTGVRSASAFHYERSHRNRLGNRCCNSSLPDTSRVIRNYSPTSHTHTHTYIVRRHC